MTHISDNEAYRKQLLKAFIVKIQTQTSIISSCKAIIFSGPKQAKRLTDWRNYFNYKKTPSLLTVQF
jgi:hypothetical protein